MCVREQGSVGRAVYDWRWLVPALCALAWAKHGVDGVRAWRLCVRHGCDAALTRQWAWQSFALGYFSLHLLQAKIRGAGGAGVASDDGPPSTEANTSGRQHMSSTGEDPQRTPLVQAAGGHV